MTKISAKRVSNYELFYDLVFVLAISNLTKLLHSDSFHLNKLLVYISAFVGILSIWFFQTIYMNKFARIDRNDVYGVIASMFIVGQMSINMTANPSNDIVLLYQLLYAAAYGTILILYIRNAKKFGFQHDMAYNMKVLAGVVGFHLIMALLFFSHILGFSHMIFLFPFLPFTIVTIFPPKQRNPINFPHLVERCQLITIISFGETVIALLNNYPLDKFPLESMIFFLTMGFLFIMYISQTFLNMEHHQKANAQRLIFSHMTLIMGLNLTTIAFELFAHHLNQLSLIYYMVGITAYYLSLLSNSTYNKEEFQISRSQFYVYLLILMIGLVFLWIFQSKLIAIAVISLVLSYAMIHVGYLYRQAARNRIQNKNA